MIAPNTIDFPVKLDGRVANERRWVCWREVKRKGKVTKVPYTPDGSRQASTDDPATWGTRAEAEKGAYVLHVAAPGRKSGIGFVIGARNKAASTPLMGFDLDTCVTESGELSDWAARIVAAFPIYWEISVSGTGLHGVGRYNRKDRQRLRDALDKHGHRHNRPDYPGQQHPPGVDIFIERGYFTFSANKWPGSPDDIKEIPTDDLLRLIEVDAPAIAGQKAEKKPKDETRSGRAWRLAIRIVAHGKGKRSYLNELYDDADLAAWAEENHPYNENRAWERAQTNYGWMAEWKRYENGNPLCNLDNTLQALRHAEDFAGLFGRDEMMRTDILMKPAPGSDEPWTGPRPVEDVDVTAIQERLQESWLVSVSKDTVHQAVELCASERKYHPVREYLKKLSWDGVERLDKWLSAYMGAEQTPYTAAIGRMFLISMVARIFRPGCKCDYMLILEDETQGKGKSVGLSILGGDWFSDSLPNVRHGDKDVSQHLNGKWLIEVSEMSAMSKADAEALKSFLTRNIEQYRPSYGRKEVREPRQCVFAGTTNKKAYLRDETGNRRFWPVATGTLDLDALRRDRDQLFAEAVVRYQRREPWWPDPEFEATHIKPEQDTRFLEDDWTDSVRHYLRNRGRVTTKDIAEMVLLFDEKQITDQITQRIAKILSRLGWQPRKGAKGKRYWIDPVPI